MNNERRKLLLWMDLFGNSNCADSSFMGRVDPAAYFPPEDYLARDSASVDPERQGSRETSRKGDAKSTQPVPTTGRSISPDLAKTRELLRTRLRDLRLDNPDKPASPGTTSSSEAEPGMPRGYWTSRVQELIARDAEQSREVLEAATEVSTLNGRSVISPLLNESNFAGLGSGRATVPADDETMACTPADAAQSLRFAKEQLVDRLFGRHEFLGDGTKNEAGETHEDQNESRDASETAAQGSVADDEADDDDEDEEDDPYRRADEGRGLLTDIPLVLGPSEIEALPMIIQTGIVDAFASKNPEGIHENMQAIRCNILISQESGRNLLRELLIFVAAWDLADDEIYVKMMVQIMEAILINGLVPYTYQSFAEYVSPFRRSSVRPRHANRVVINQDQGYHLPRSSRGDQTPHAHLPKQNHTDDPSGTLSHGAFPSPPSPRTSHPLHVCAFPAIHHPGDMRLDLSSGPDPTGSDQRGRFPLEFLGHGEGIRRGVSILGIPRCTHRD